MKMNVLKVEGDVKISPYPISICTLKMTRWLIQKLRKYNGYPLLLHQYSKAALFNNWKSKL